LLLTQIFLCAAIIIPGFHDGTLYWLAIGVGPARAWLLYLTFWARVTPTWAPQIIAGSLVLVLQAVGQWLTVRPLPAGAGAEYSGVSRLGQWLAVANLAGIGIGVAGLWSAMPSTRYNGSFRQQYGVVLLLVEIVALIPIYLILAQRSRQMRRPTLARWWLAVLGGWIAADLLFILSILDVSEDSTGTIGIAISALTGVISIVLALIFLSALKKFSRPAMRVTMAPVSPTIPS
jgi:hypothetical protein